MQSSKSSSEPARDRAPVIGGAALSAELSARCQAFLTPLLTALDTHVDRRLVRTAAHTVGAILRHRNRPTALVLSELGEVVAGPTHAPAGTKRVSNLLRSPNWQATEVEAWLAEHGRDHVVTAAAAVPEGRALCILDGSVLEKPESAQADGLRPVRSSKARRLSRPRPKLGPGYYSGPPGKPVVVPGWQWLAAVATSWTEPHPHRPLTLGAWYTYQHPIPPPAAAPEPSGPTSSTATAPAPVPDPIPETIPPALVPAPGGDALRSSADQGAVPVQRDREAQAAVLEPLVAVWGPERLLHVWDRGLSGAPWLDWVLDRDWHFVVRWKKGNRLRRADAPSVGHPQATPTARDRDGIAAWKLTRGRRAWGSRLLANPRSPTQRLRVSVLAQPVRLLHRDTPLWLVVARLGKGSGRRRGSLEPLRLLTTEPVETEAQCWRIVEAYRARWEVEQVLRFGKSELGLESIRVRDGDARRKLLALASLAYAFLVGVVAQAEAAVLTPLLRWAHRTGRQAQAVWRPLYRGRAALANLWSAHPPALAYPV